MKALFWIVQALFGAWIISALVQAPDASTECAGLPADIATACQEGTQVGMFIGVMGIIALWAFVNVILFVIGRMARRGPKAATQ